ncbi:response regulator [Polyangium sorediatum]|uniref:Response regulator n=1 Tax=Polyangium sorediatum TaxID=889274 RepID=A0ABT6P9I6_9BACT|nr:response regulator [Polyangium sorediatum]MDI1437290.1 response regulator [Polyangium sorediatum]
MIDDQQNAMSEADGCRLGTILVVDDDPGVLEALETLLVDEGYRVVTACHGRAALSYLAEHEAPCVILLDMMMPIMDGYGFLAEQRQHPALSRIPVVVLTAGANSNRVRALCPTGFLSKPVDVDALLAFLEEYC